MISCDFRGLTVIKYSRFCIYCNGIFYPVAGCCGCYIVLSIDILRTCQCAPTVTGLAHIHGVKLSSESDKKKIRGILKENLSELQSSRNKYIPLMLPEKSYSSNAIWQSVLANQVDKENVKELLPLGEATLRPLCRFFYVRPHLHHLPAPPSPAFIPSPLLNLSLPSGLHFYSSHVDHTVSDSG